MTASVQTILRNLCQLPHRGAATPEEAEAAQRLTEHLTDLGATVRIEPFQTPKTYATVVYWLTGGLLAGLALVPVTGVAVGFVWYFAWLAWRYVNWQYSFITKFPVQHTAHNVIGRWTGRGANRRKVILMAHYDTAPVSGFYRPGRLAQVRPWLITSLVLMGVAGLVAFAEVMDVGRPYVTYGRYGLLVYFVIQAVMSTLGYWRKGYTNGASNNATGVAAALVTADRLWQADLPHLDIEVVLTSANEVGMIGAYQYVQQHKREWRPTRPLVINFDTFGAGKLTVVEQTGTLAKIRYENEPTRLARSLIQTDAFRDRVQVGRWPTADFDSVWLVRAGIPVLALCALDEAGQMPCIPQPNDTLDAVDTTPVYDAIDFASAVVREWLALNTP